MFDYTKSIVSAEADIVVASAINESLTHTKQLMFNENAEVYDEEYVARNYGAAALDHFRAIRHHRDELKKIITTPKI